jgi:hypothetical protein
MFPRTGFLGHRTWQGSFPSAGAALTLPLAQPPEQLGQADLQDVGDLAGGVHRDVDPAVFEQAHCGIRIESG